MKYIEYTPPAHLTSFYEENKRLKESKDAFIFHNLIVINLETLTIDEFNNSFNDINDPKYLDFDYKKKVVRAYFENQREFPNEDLMYFDKELSYIEKKFIAIHSKNEKMIEILSQDDDSNIREMVAFREELPKHIIDKLIVDPVASVRESIIIGDCPLSKDQIKLFAKDNDSNISRILFANQKIKIDDELIDYLVKYGSLTIKERLVDGHYPLTDEQIEYLLLPIHSNIDIKCSLVMFYKLSEKILFNLLKTNQIQLLRQVAYRDDLTIPMVEKLLAKNNDTLKLALASNNTLFSHSPKIYQYLISTLLRDSSLAVIKKAIYGYIHNLSNDLMLSSDILAHLIEVNYKNGDEELANLILDIPDIPQYMVERVAFDSSINHLIEFDYNYGAEYDMIGIHTPYFHLVLMIKDYVQKVGYTPYK